MESNIFDYIQNHPTFPTTGADLSEAGDGSIWACKVLGKVYILSACTIALPTDSSYLFAYSTSDGPIENDDGDWVGDMRDTYYEGIGEIFFNNVDTSNVTDMSYMFSCEESVFTDCYPTYESLDLSMFDTSNVTNMVGMFYDCGWLKELDLSSFDTSKVNNADDMFLQCNNLNTIYAGKLWSMLGLLDSANNMFFGCDSLVGAVAYDDQKTDETMANYTNGYLTLKLN